MAPFSPDIMQLLRLVYRCFFSLLLKDRDLLLLPGAAVKPDSDSELLFHYVFEILAKSNAAAHHDRISTAPGDELAGSDSGCTELAFPLWGFLFDARLPADSMTQTDNRLSYAVRSLAFITEGNTRRQ
jgi:hypothetical protein